MKTLKVKSIKLDSDGELIIKTNISDNLELAKHIDKDRIEKSLNNNPLEMHIYQNDYCINSIRWQGELICFTFNDLKEFLMSKHK